MIEKLKALPIEALLDLSDALKVVLEEKKRHMLRPGVLATFTDTRVVPPVERTICIERINPKTISGYVVENGRHMRERKWKVGHGLLRPVIERKKPAVSLGTGADRPAAQASW